MVLRSDPHGESLSFADLKVDRATGETTKASTKIVTAYAGGLTDPELSGHVENLRSRT